MSDEGGTRLRVGLWERLSGSTWRKVGEPETWTDVSVDARLRAPGAWTMQQPWDTQSARFRRGQLVTFDLIRPGGATYRALTGLLEGYGPAEDERGTLSLEASGSGALTLLRGVLAAPRPDLMPATGPYPRIIIGQPLRYTATGAAEDVLRDVIVANRDRLGLSFVIPASAGRGGTVRIKTRWGDLMTLIARKCRQGGLGVNFGLVDTSGSRATLTLSFYGLTDKSKRVQLARDTGSLRTWKQTHQAPTATRAVVGGAGKGVDRMFRYVVDGVSENNWGFAQETFVDSRESDQDAELQDAGEDALASAASQTTWELDAVEAVGMRWLQHFQLGDTVTIRVLPGLEETAELGAAVVSASAGGVGVKLVPGNPDNQTPLFQTAAIMRQMRGDLRGLQREEG